MLNIKMMKPFYTLQEGNDLKLVFAYQYFSIIKENEVYQFIPVESNEIRINIQTTQIENLTDIFVFQRGTKIFRVRLFQLLQISDLLDHLQSITSFHVQDVKSGDNSEKSSQEVLHFEKENLHRLIDKALLEGDREQFMSLTEQFKTEEAAH
ncbi:IDEAL domain-containing protein [Jeotgalibacillus marinus]|uniref:IDEAL domain-containing protein n=1 Tax=Jeotgalibacillus marinus TaxID=86667 RepID=A0ABV3Q4N0_9BACL